MSHAVEVPPQVMGQPFEQVEIALAVGAVSPGGWDLGDLVSQGVRLDGEL